jgi:hypothetical protein
MVWYSEFRAAANTYYDYPQILSLHGVTVPSSIRVNYCSCVSTQTYCITVLVYYSSDYSIYGTCSQQGTQRCCGIVLSVSSPVEDAMDGWLDGLENVQKRNAR